MSNCQKIHPDSQTFFHQPTKNKITRVIMPTTTPPLSSTTTTVTNNDKNTSPKKTTITTSRRKLGDGKVSQLLSRFQQQAEQQQSLDTTQTTTSSRVGFKTSSTTTTVVVDVPSPTSSAPHSSLSNSKEDLRNIRLSVRVRDTFTYWHKQEEEHIRQELNSARLIKPLARANSFTTNSARLHRTDSSNNTSRLVNPSTTSSTSPRSVDSVSTGGGRRNSIDSNSSTSGTESTENSSSIHSYASTTNQTQRDSNSAKKYWYDHLLQSPPPVLVNSLLGNPSYDFPYTNSMMMMNDDYDSFESVQYQIEEELRMQRAQRNSFDGLDDADTFNASSETKKNRLNVPVMDLYRVYRDKSVIYNQQYPHYVLSLPFIHNDSVYVNENGSHSSLDDMYNEEAEGYEEEMIDDAFPSLDQFSQWTNTMQKRLDEKIMS